MQNAHCALQLSVGCKAEVGSNSVQGTIHDAEVEAEQHGSQGAHEHTEENGVVGLLQHPKQGASKKADCCTEKLCAMHREVVCDAHGKDWQESTQGCKGADTWLNKDVLWMTPS